MRDDVIDRDAIAQMNRCRRAARSFAWWGRITLALWVLEVFVVGEKDLILVPGWMLFVVTEILAPAVKRGRNLAAAAAVHAVAAPAGVYLFWFATDGEIPGEPGRILAMTFAIALLGVVSSWHTGSAWHHGPRPNPGRRPEEVARHRRIALAAVFAFGSWVLAFILSALPVFSTGLWSIGLKMVFFAGLLIALAVHLFLLLRRGVGAQFVVTLLVLVLLSSLFAGIAMVSLTVIEPLAWIAAALFLGPGAIAITLLAVSVRPGTRPPPAWGSGRRDVED